MKKNAFLFETKLLFVLGFSLFLTVSSVVPSYGGILEKFDKLCLLGTPCDPTQDLNEVYMIPNWDKLPHKNQEESKERVAEVNTLLPEKTNKWTYNAEQPTWACLSFAAATTCDWWALQLGWKLGTYTNFYNGKTEEGFNPRQLEALYLTRAHVASRLYPILLFPADPVHSSPFPISEKGYGDILSSDFTGTISDPTLPDVKWEYKQKMYPMEGKWAFHKRGLITKVDEYNMKLIQLIHHFGILYTKIELNEKYTVLPGEHGVTIVGYGKVKKTGETVFVYQDNYGNNPKTYDCEFGGPAYRYAPCKKFESVIVFPHKPVAQIVPQNGNFAVKFANSGGQPITAQFVAYVSAKGKPTKATLKGDTFLIPVNAAKNGFIDMYVEAEFYMQDIGKGYSLKVAVPSK
ncbi:MAG: hypothetical protein HQM08_05290 [Candidatus Riflebacteria bacterium]|nr:hypothetical protein [Candidatus Riflebacteria bacterium]